MFETRQLYRLQVRAPRLDKLLIFIAAGAKQMAADFMLGSMAEAEAKYAMVGMRIPLIVTISKHSYLYLYIHR